MNVNQRRQEIIDLLVENGHLHVADLMEKLGVSRRTILYDIEELSLIYPIYTLIGGAYGGVYISEDYKPGNRYINDEEVKVLKELIPKANVEQRKVLEDLINKFSIKHRTV